MSTIFNSALVFRTSKHLTQEHFTPLIDDSGLVIWFLRHLHGKEVAAGWIPGFLMKKKK